MFNVYLDFCLKNLLFILNVRLYILVYVVMLSLITLSDNIMTYVMITFIVMLLDDFILLKP